jgi:hypothetical protein
MELPKDLLQHPDLFVSVYSGKDRKAFYRLPSARLHLGSETEHNENPRWYQLQPIKMGDSIKLIFLKLFIKDD